MCQRVVLEVKPHIVTTEEHFADILFTEYHVYNCSGSYHKVYDNFEDAIGDVAKYKKYCIKF